MLVLFGLALTPQVAFRFREAQSWSGSYFSFNPDETAYLAYVNALKDGRPRKSDPYSGRDDRDDAHQPESIFSIQLAPAYALALAARMLRIPVQRMFAILSLLVAITAAAGIFELIYSVSNEPQISTVSSVFVLCCGSLSYAPVVTRFQAHGHAQYFPFLRGYQPSFGFPFFIVFVIVVWLCLRTNDARKKMFFSLIAAATFLLLLFSYFYLWTAAMAWLAIALPLWLIFEPQERWKNFLALLVFAAIAASGFWGYWQLLSRRAASTDAFQVLTISHRPDLLRASEIIGLALVMVLAYLTRRGTIHWREPRVLFIFSLALLPLIVFNQQVLTGYSIQPIHYELFVSNYVALIALVLTVASFLRRKSSLFQTRAVLVRAVCARGWGAVEMTYAMRARLEVNRLRDMVRPAALTLARKSAAEQSSLVLVTNLVQADVLPADAPQPVLWAPHMRSFPGVSAVEEKARYSAQLYFMGIDATTFESLLRETKTVPSVVFGWERVNSHLTSEPNPISEEEVRQEVRRYADYVATFDHARAASVPLGFVVASRKDNLSNLDRWYARDDGEPVGNLMLYRVRLR